MHLFEPQSWDEFKRMLHRLLTDSEQKRQLSEGVVPDMLFRGHSNSEWELRTTLERYTTKIATWSLYLDIADATRPQIETMTGQRWKALSGSDPWCSKKCEAFDKCSSRI